MTVLLAHGGVAVEYDPRTQKGVAWLPLYGARTGYAVFSYDPDSGELGVEYLSNRACEARFRETVIPLLRKELHDHE